MNCKVSASQERKHSLSKLFVMQWSPQKLSWIQDSFEAVHYGHIGPVTYRTSFLPFLSGCLVHVTFCLFFIPIIEFNIFVEMKRMQQVEQRSFQV